MNNLALSRLALMSAYLGLSAYIAVSAIAVQDESLLLDSLTLNLIIFVVGVLTKKSDLLLASWVWLGANFITEQATLSGITYLSMICSIVFIFVMVDLSNFLEFLYPMHSGSRQIDNQEYERSWLLFKKHARFVTLFAACAGTLAGVGFAIITPVGVVSDPVLAVGIVLSIVLVLVVVLSLEWRGDSKFDGRLRG